MPSVLLVSDNVGRSKPLAGIIKERLHYPLHALPIVALQALSQREIGDFDILILDISAQMANMLDEEIAKIRMLLPAISVLVLYPFGDVEAEALAAHAGADDMLARPVSYERLQMTLKNLLRLKAQPPLAKLHTEIRSSKHIVLLDSQGKMKKLRHLEAEVILHALDYYQGRIVKVAKALGVGRSTLYRKIEEFDLKSKSAA